MSGWTLDGQNNLEAIQMDTRTEYLTTDQLAELTHSQPQTWRRRRMTGDGPSYVKWGSRVLYRRSCVEEWLTKQSRRSTADTGTAR